MTDSKVGGLPDGTDRKAPKDPVHVDAINRLLEGEHVWSKSMTYDRGRKYSVCVIPGCSARQVYKVQS